MPDDEKPLLLHVTASDLPLPEKGPDLCPDCKVPYDVGFGMAGGGYGAYTYCPQCGKILSKTLEKE